MKLAQICPYSLSERGGVQAQVFGLARSLAALGHEVTVVGPSDAPVPDPDTFSIISVGSSVPVEANGSVAPISIGVGGAARTIRLLARHHFELLHLHEPLVPGPTIASLIAARVPMVGTFHLSGTSASYAYLGPLVRRWARKLAVRCCVSEEARDTAASYLGGEYRVLFNGVDLERWGGRRPGGDRVDLERWGGRRPGGDRVDLERWGGRNCGDSEHSPVIAFVGRHEPRKGLAVLLDAFARLRGEWGDRAKVPVLKVAGEGPETGHLRSSTVGSEGVEWLGSIDDQGVVDLVSGADVLCAPSTGGESFGIVLAEAMAAGTPVVASDIPGYRQVAGGGGAVLVPPGNTAALAAALSSVLADRGLAEALVTAGSVRAASFSLRSLATRYSEIYASLV